MPIATRPEHRTARTPGNGTMPHHESKKPYSLMRAVRLVLEDRKLDGLEGETHDELNRLSDGRFKGIAVPMDLTVPSRRDLSSIAGSGAGSIGTTYPDRLFVDVLRSKLVVASLGGQVRDFAGGRPGRVEIPSKLTAGSVTWVAEGVTPSSTNMTTNAPVLVPHTVVTQANGKQSATPSLEMTSGAWNRAAELR